MTRLFLLSSIVLFFLSGSLMADVMEERELDVQESILSLHTSAGPAKDNIVWGECGKRVRGENAFERSGEYAKAIVSSVDMIEKETGEKINLDYMVSVLFRESSHDECVIGRQETRWLTEQLGRAPTKDEIIEHVKSWTALYYDAKKECRDDGRNNDMKCIGNVVGRQNPHYRGIHGWDLGAAQYRWPGYNFRRRMFMLPGGRLVEKVGLKEIFDYEVSIHMLAQDMARYRSDCRGHTHWLTSRWGKRLRQLDPDEAYFAHHHTGGGSWSETYWKAVTRHLDVIKKNRKSKLLAMSTMTRAAAISY